MRSKIIWAGFFIIIITLACFGFLSYRLFENRIEDQMKSMMKVELSRVEELLKKANIYGINLSAKKNEAPPYKENNKPAASSQDKTKTNEVKETKPDNILSEASKKKVSEVISQSQWGKYGYFWLFNEADKGGKNIIHSGRLLVIPPYYFVVDQKDTIDYINNNHKAYVIKFSKEGADRIVAYTPVNNSKWILVMTLPSIEYKPILDEAKLTILSFISALGFLGFVIFVFIVYFITQPITDIRNFAIKLISGQEPDKLEIKTKDELEDIAYCLKKIKDTLVEREKYQDQSPVTGLPGNHQLQKVLFDRIDGKEKFAVAFLDINDFSAYNHKCGFDKGDSIIRHLATIITNNLKEKGNKEDFLSHIGGDHFVLVTTPDKIDEIGKSIINEFDQQVPFYYVEEDRKKGYILSKDRQGNIEKCGLMTLAISVATNEQRPLIHPLQIAQVTGELRNYQKTQKGKSDMMKDRRIADREEDSAEADIKKSSDPGSSKEAKQGA
ncbi:MAG: diguanylate cyclase [Firmicutes bacterium]|nr:diguanylate cyclase [Bacillota bacterium]